jgi:hypothetical protein
MNMNKPFSDHEKVFKLENSEYTAHHGSKSFARKNQSTTTTPTILTHFRKTTLHHQTHKHHIRMEDIIDNGDNID